MKFTTVSLRRSHPFVWVCPRLIYAFTSPLISRTVVTCITTSLWFAASSIRTFFRFLLSGRCRRLRGIRAIRIVWILFTWWIFRLVLSTQALSPLEGTTHLEDRNGNGCKNNERRRKCRYSSGVKEVPANDRAETRKDRRLIKNIYTHLQLNVFVKSSQYYNR